jgi:aminoglycoside phosphotransferase
MVLIKSTPERNRQVFELDDCYRKVWGFKDLKVLEKHVDIMKYLWPDYIQRYGWTDDTMWIDVKKITGVSASNYEHTDEFVKKIYNFCLDNIKKTTPYAHYDWVLSNIIIDGDQISLIDWDNVGIYTEEEIFKKLHADLKSAFGDKFDPTSI